MQPAPLRRLMTAAAERGYTLIDSPMNMHKPGEATFMALVLKTPFRCSEAKG